MPNVNLSNINKLAVMKTAASNKQRFILTFI